MQTYFRIHRLVIPALAALSSAACFGNSVFTNDVLALNPIGYWQFDGNLLDSSGNGHNATSSTGIGYTTGAPDGDTPNQAVMPTSSTPNITIADPGNSMNFDFTSNFSVMAWVFVPTNTGSFGFQTILARDNGSLGYFLGVDSIGRLSFETAIGGGAIIAGTANQTYNNGAWHFVVGTFAGGATVDERIYVDGVLQGDNNRGNAGTFADPGGSLTFLCCNENDGVFPWGPMTGGALDEAAIFGSTLSAAQVQTLYNAASQSPNTTPEPSTVIVISTGLMAIALRRWRGSIRLGS